MHNVSNCNKLIELLHCPLLLQTLATMHAIIATMNPNTEAATIAPTTLPTLMLTVRLDAA